MLLGAGLIIVYCVLELGNYDLKSLIYLLGGIAVAIVSIFMLIGYFSTPRILISLNSDGNLVLPKNVIVSTNEIHDISYKKAFSKAAAHNWGTVVLETDKGIFSLKYIDDCEEVCKTLTKLTFENSALSSNLKEDTHSN